MSSGKGASQTAMVVASLRALACYEEDPCIRGKDELAELFLPAEKRIPLRHAESRGVIKKMIPSGLYEYVIARTRFFDELFLHHLKQRIPQIVLLGAGFDSRAYRFENEIESTIIFEADLPATQKEKRAILKENGVRCPRNLRYVAADFERDDVFEGLRGACFDGSLATLFIWEGVTFYLSPRSVEAMLAAVRQRAAPGSILCFDFQHMEDRRDLIDTGLGDEAIRFGMPAEGCGEYLGGFGYSVRERVDAEQMGDRYMTMASGERFGAINPIMNFVQAEVC